MAINSMTDGAVQSVLKELYSGQKVKEADYEDHPFLAMVAKKTNFTGRTFPLPIVYGHGAGISASFTNAQDNVDGLDADKFELTRVKGYAVARIDGEVAEASMGSLGSFLELVTAEIDAKRRGLTNMIAASLFRNGRGSIGTVGAYAGGSATSFTLAKISDVVNFYVGQRLQACVSETTALDDSSVVTVVSVNRDTGVIDVGEDIDAAISTGTAFTVGFFIFPEGNSLAGGSSKVISGLDAWLPASTPTSAAFFGVDRSVEPTRLGGVRYNGASEPMLEAIINCAARLRREGAKPDVLLLNPVDWAKLAISQEGKVVYDKAKATGGLNLSFDAIAVMTPAGLIKVVADSDCPTDIGYMLTMSTWKLCSIGDVPKLLDRDGNRVLRVSNADQLECRLGYYAQLGCEHPGANARIAFA